MLRHKTGNLVKDYGVFCNLLYVFPPSNGQEKVLKYCSLCWFCITENLSEFAAKDIF